MYCRYCGRDIVHTADLALCPHCAPSVAPARAMPNKKKPVIEWENPSRPSIITVFFLTIRDVLFHADAFFKKINEESCLFYAFLFGLTVNSIAAVGDFLSQWLPVSPWNSSDHPSFDSAQLFNGAQSLLYAPVIGAITLLTASFYVQGMLIVTRSRRASFKSTFIAVCYMQSAFILTVIPVFGFILSALWYLYLMISGISIVHAVNRVRTFMVVFFPFFFVLIVFSFIILTLFGGALFISTLVQKYLAIFNFF